MSNSNNEKIEPRFGPVDIDQAENLNEPLAEADQAAAEQADTPNKGEPSAAEFGFADPELEKLREELNQSQERLMRVMAEGENIRRRAVEDVSKAHKFGIESFAQALIPVKDSLEMALKVESPTVEGVTEGVQATLRQLITAFEKNKLIEIDPVGEKFDPNVHQAISMVPVADTDPAVAPNHIVTVLQKGYLINDRVLRPALVTVAQA